MSLVVSKFGGTSMGDSACMLRSASVCIKQKSKVIVVSATSGTTNDLIKVGQLCEAGHLSEAETLCCKISERHLKIANELQADADSLTQLNQLLIELESLTKGIFLLRECSAKAFDTLISLGERISSVLFVNALRLKLHTEKLNFKCELLDVRSIIKTDDTYNKARPLVDEIKKNGEAWLKTNFQKDTLYVTQGFIGQTLNGATTTLGRGGSDYSAALLAEALHSQTLEIWTDVPGVATTDPRLCPAATSLTEISFQEMSELATFGAKVLHPATLLPAMRQNIPVLVASSFQPELPGTWVKKEVKKNPLIRALALRKNQTLITMSTPDMLHTHGFLFQIFKVFNDYKISIDAITTSEISISVTIDHTEKISDLLIQDLSQIAEIQIEKDLSLVSLIGNNINHTPGLAKQIFESIPEVNVRMICFGASRHNFCFLIKDQYGSEVINKLHRKFIL